MLLGLLAIVGLVFLLVAFASRGHGRNREWRILALIAFCVFPAIFIVTALQASLHSMQDVEFCGSCHSMENYVGSLTYDDDEPLASVHYRNNYVSQKTACYKCHTSYAMFGGVKAKMNGLRHVWVHVAKGGNEEIELYEPYGNENCLGCHGPSERFQKEKKHLEEEGFLAKSKSGEMSCLQSGCHDEGHYWESDDEGDDDEW